MAKISKELEELRQKDRPALQKELADTRIALQKARIDVAFGRLPKTSSVGVLRRRIARVQTLLKAQEVKNG